MPGKIKTVCNQVKVMKDKRKWVYQLDPTYFYLKNTNNTWDEFSNNQKTSTLNFRTFEDESVVLEDKTKRRFIQINKNRVLIGSDQIESLDSVRRKFFGEWGNFKSFNRKLVKI